MSANLKDQLRADYDGKVEFSPEGGEPLLNAWLDVRVEDETISYMLVNGAYIRSHVFIDFVEGGHYYRYGWIPEGQIWLEDVMSVVDQVCTGVHETHERYRMKHLGQSYEKAHFSACKIEMALREMALEPDTILPGAKDLVRIFEAEASGEDCLPIAKEVFHSNEEKAREANRQANASEGKARTASD